MYVCNTKITGLLDEWHFFTTNHGNSMYGCIGGTLNQNQNGTTDDILTPEQLYRWTHANMSGIKK